MPKVSVVIPTYRHSHYIIKTLESVFAQTFADFEVIVVNDGSPDDTAAVLQPWIARLGLIYIEQANAGQASARNRGVETAKGEFIAFLDDDDLWPPDKLMWQVDKLVQYSTVGVVGGSACLINAVGDLVEKLPIRVGVESKWSLFSSCPMISPGQALIRRSVLSDVGPLRTDVPGGDDYDLWFRVERRHKILMVDRLALSYRIHPHNASRNITAMLLSTCTVIDTNLRLESRVARRRYLAIANKYIYVSYGRRLILSLPRPWRPRAVCTRADLAAAWKLTRRAALDYRLMCGILIDLLPRATMHRVWKQLHGGFKRGHDLTFGSTNKSSR